ncbi:MAG TPA: hypothetical protein VGI16_13855 [Candidatus Acidoferrum sp.]|jgi:hypothetical protein
MPAPARELSLDHHLLERLKFSGMDRENVADLISIAVSLKNKYGIAPFSAIPQGHPVRDALTLRYLMETSTLTKIINVLLDTPRIHTVSISPRGIPRTSEFEVRITLGG